MEILQKTDKEDWCLLQKNIETKTLRYYSQENDHGIVSFYQEYIALCEKLYMDDPNCDAFYRHTLSNIMNSIRLSKQPIGVNYLSKIIKSIASKGELKGRFTAHSGKVTGISQMYDAGVPEITIFNNEVVTDLLIHWENIVEAELVSKLSLHLKLLHLEMLPHLAI